MRVIKRDGRIEQFDSKKIKSALTRSSDSVEPENRLSADTINELTKEITEKIKSQKVQQISIEDIQDIVENELIEHNYPFVAKHYIIYRYKHDKYRKADRLDNLISETMAMLDGVNQEVIDDNANKSPSHHNVARDYMAGFLSKAIAKEMLPSDIWRAHKDGLIHFHDADYSPAMRETNCELIDLEDMLKHGTNMGGTFIHTPHSLATAMTIASQVSMNVASSSYGGQTITLSHLAPFVDISREKYKKQVKEEFADCGIDYSDDVIDTIAEKRVRREIESAVQTLQYQEITCACSNGQSPFITIFMYLDEVPEGRTRDDLALIIEEVLRQRIKGVQADDGSWVSPVFPKLIYVLDEDNMEEDSKYYHITRLAAECTAKRLVPDYVSAKVMKQVRGEVFSSMGCRSQLSVYYPKDHPECIIEVDPCDNNNVKCVDGKWHDKNKAVFYGRFNMGVVTLNLPDVALSALDECDVDPSDIGSTDFTDNSRIMKVFNKIFNERLELCHRALRFRYERLRGTPSNAAPILWNYGAMARLEKNETIDRLLVNGWATISLGYSGLYEMVKAMTGKSHTEDIGREFGMKVMQKLHDICNTWKQSEPEHLGYSLYGTPMENTTTKFAKALKNRHPESEINRKLYITNSYHIPVFEKIDAFTKLSKEAPFQELSSGGSISYIELPSMLKNIDAVISIIKHIYNTNIYAEINTKADHCMKCGYSGEIELKNTVNGDFELECPNCHNKDARSMYAIRRICGYIGRIDSKDNPVNSRPSSSEGRLGDIFDRVVHL